MHRQASGEYLSSHSLKIESKRDLVIVSCGGLPWDINLIQAHKALDMATYACVEGGTIILLAECGDGFGRPDFLKWFECENSSVLEERLRKDYEVNGQTAWSLLTKTEAYRIYLISKLAEEDVRRMRMTPARSLADAVADIDEYKQGYILPRGAALLPVAELP
jgi:nickel-dependent lactate racemase